MKFCIKLQPVLKVYLRLEEFKKQDWIFKLLFISKTSDVKFDLSIYEKDVGEVRLLKHRYLNDRVEALFHLHL